MAFQCDRCGKKIVITSQQRHKKGVAGGRWKYRAPKSRKLLKPNLQTYRGILNGKKGVWKLCTQCLKTIKKKKKEVKKEKPVSKAN
jgi:ribosomal protein L28